MYLYQWHPFAKIKDEWQNWTKYKDHWWSCPFKIYPNTWLNLWNLTLLVKLIFVFGIGLYSTCEVCFRLWNSTQLQTWLRSWNSLELDYTCEIRLMKSSRVQSQLDSSIPQLDLTRPTWLVYSPSFKIYRKWKVLMFRDRKWTIKFLDFGMLTSFHSCLCAFHRATRPRTPIH